ncbi:hypothetical protein ACFB49_13140 [Sphingomonas sp. DBB INV C78]|uniref:hypothetical protein n=1 Tax=Sphingomonas sp. DBB INV C78 TaxID=3349434 RepID=UPI0036D2BFEC
MGMMKMVVRSAAVATLVLVAACSGSSDEVAPEANVEENVVNVSDVPELPADNQVAPEPVVETNTADATPPEAPVPPDAQMLDDADATGMTARVNRDAAAENGAVTTEGE